MMQTRPIWGPLFFLISRSSAGHTNHYKARGPVRHTPLARISPRTASARISPRTASARRPVCTLKACHRLARGKCSPQSGQTQPRESNQPTYQALKVRYNLPCSARFAANTAKLLDCGQLEKSEPCPERPLYCTRIFGLRTVTPLQGLMIAAMSGPRAALQPHSRFPLTLGSPVARLQRATTACLGSRRVCSFCIASVSIGTLHPLLSMFDDESSARAAIVPIWRVACNLPRVIASACRTYRLRRPARRLHLAYSPFAFPDVA